MGRRIPLCGVEIPAHAEASVPGKTGAFSHIAVTDDLGNHLPYKSGTIQCLERCGVYRGAGNYRFHTEGKGVLLLGGSDIVTVRRDGKPAETYASMGAARWFTGCGCYEVTASVWGHSNFADARQPALMLDSPKGLSGAVDVRGVQKLESNWFFSYYEGSLPDTLRIPQRAVETVVSINSWNTTRTPLRAVYRKMVRPAAGCDAYFLELRHACAEATLYVDGQPVGLFNPLDPFLDVSRFLRGKESAELELCVTKRDWSEPVGTPVLYSGRFITACDFAPFTQAALTAAVATARPETKSVLPLRLEAGSFTVISMALTEAPKESCYLRVRGRNILTAVWAGARLVGRTLFWDGSPRMCGECELIYLPQSYREGCQSLRMLVAALSEGAELTAVETVTVD